MSGIERMTITMPAEMAASVKHAVDGGGYASISEVVREALREWTARRAVERQELDALRADIAKGLADIEAGRTKPFDAERIAAQGRALLARRSPSA